jgi:hypothetical protein
MNTKLALACASLISFVCSFLPITRAQDASVPEALNWPAAAAVLKPGAIITRDNQDKFAGYLPAAAKFVVTHGFRIRVMPSRKFEWSRAYREATEKYSRQVKLADDDTMVNYTAGMPFPFVELTDPKAALKIAYDWHMGPFMPDDFSLSPWTSNSYLANSADPLDIAADPNSDYSCEHFNFLRLAHRIEVDPRPSLDGNVTDVEWMARCNQFLPSAPGIAVDNAGIWVRYLEPRRSDDFFTFDELWRHIHRHPVNHVFPKASCRECHQPYWAYALPKTEVFTYRLLSTVPILACLGADDESGGFARNAKGLTLGEEPFEMRSAYILEMSPREPQVSGERIIVFIDSEVYVWLAAEFYSSDGLEADAIPLWSVRPSPTGGATFDLTGSFYHAAGGAFFRSLAPANGDFRPAINQGRVSESVFAPAMLAH